MTCSAPSAAAPSATLLPWRDLDPNALLRRWPPDRALAALHSSGPVHEDARWTLLAEPQPSRLIPLEPREEGLASLRDAIDDCRIDRALPPGEGLPPFSGGWCVCFAYEMGRWFEPTACGPALEAAVDDRGWPAAILAPCPCLLAFDRRERRWWWIGEEAPPAWIESLPESAETCVDGTLHDLRPDHDATRFEAAVARTVELIHAGDLFQANIAQRFTAELRGSVRGFASRALPASGAAFGAYLEASLAGGTDRRAILSLSPERFLRIAADGRIATSPIKGTRPASASEQELLGSAKDAAELAMIVDLMRNDLGRVCELGSISVPTPRRIDRHPTVLHGVAEVEGRLREGVRSSDLLAATFPPGSVTGAPKIRAMQVIDRLEPVRRGPYCGAIGWIDRRHGAILNVAIRTLLLRSRSESAAACDYLAGCGIVAESDPAAESRESLDKTAVLRALLA